MISCSFFVLTTAIIFKNISLFLFRHFFRWRLNLRLIVRRIWIVPVSILILSMSKDRIFLFLYRFWIRSLVFWSCWFGREGFTYWFFSSFFVQDPVLRNWPILFFGRFNIIKTFVESHVSLLLLFLFRFDCASIFSTGQILSGSSFQEGFSYGRLFLFFDFFLDIFFRNISNTF